ncbi:hypothetical protein PG990_005724 [Apiospora arundinis]
MMMTPKSFFYSRQSQLPLSPSPSPFPTPPSNKSRLAFLQRRDAPSTTNDISRQPTSTKTSQSGYSTEKMTKRKEPDSRAASPGRSPPELSIDNHCDLTSNDANERRANTRKLKDGSRQQAPHQVSVSRSIKSTIIERRVPRPRDSVVRCRTTISRCTPGWDEYTATQ